MLDGENDISTNTNSNAKGNMSNADNVTGIVDIYPRTTTHSMNRLMLACNNRINIG